MASATLWLFLRERLPAMLFVATPSCGIQENVQTNLPNEARQDRDEKPM
jgi:hypothetical protein